MPRNSLLLAIAIAIFGHSEIARGDTITAPHFDAETHARQCKCNSCRGDSCCCGRTSAPRQPTTTSTPLPSRRESSEASGPCFGEAPCGDPGLPASTPPGPNTRAAVSLTTPSRRPMTAGALLPPPDSRRPISGRPARIDRPPRA